MLTGKELIEKVLAYNPHADVKLIEKAYVFSEKAHKGQKRESGEDYFSHPLAVAEILTNMMADSATIASALLHDIIEDTSVSSEQVEREFGKEVRQLVEAVTKLKKIDFKDKSDYTASNLRKVIIASTKDVRVILIKLADKLHNMRTLNSCLPDKQKRIALEVEKIYAPIAHKLGMFNIHGELEDYALRYLNPTIYAEIRDKLAERRDVREKETQRLIAILEEALKKKGLDARVFGRAKWISSIFKKMLKRNKDFDEIYDLIALRIIVNTVPECYTSLGVVHELYKPLPGRFKDYISLPKANGYRSLHTKVVSERGQIVEVQIRTWDMHYEAEYGIAAHWRYKGDEKDKAFDRKIVWLKEIMDWKAQSSTASDFVETLKIDLFKDEIVVFTPKGDPISLPEGSTPVDFAYAVHSNLGNSTHQAKVNGRIMPLDTQLSSGDIIEIMSQKNAKPSRQWLKFVKTSRAKTKIRSLLNIKSEPGTPHVQEDERLLDREEVIMHDTKYKNYKISKCCNPLPGDKIVGLVSPDNKVHIHKESCPNIHSQKTPKFVKVSWAAPEKTTTFDLVLVVEDRIGLLLDVLNIMSRERINIASIHTKTQHNHVLITLKVTIPDATKLESMLSAMKNIDNVLDVKMKQEGRLLSKDDIIKKLTSLASAFKR